MDYLWFLGWLLFYVHVIKQIQEVFKNSLCITFRNKSNILHVTNSYEAFQENLLIYNKTSFSILCISHTCYGKFRKDYRRLLNSAKYK